MPTRVSTPVIIPHGSNGNETVGTIGGFLLLLVVAAIGLWVLITRWSNQRRR